MSLSALFARIPVSLTDRLGCCAWHFLWQGAAIAAGLWLVLRICRRGTAELRHALCGMALLLMAAAPVITWQRLPLPQTKVKTVVLPPASGVAQRLDGLDLLALEGPQTAGSDSSSAPWTPGLKEHPFAEDESSSRSVKQAAFTPPHSLWQRRLGGLWLAGAGLMGFWRLCALGGTFRIIHRGERAAGELLDQVARMARHCGLKRVPGVRITGRLISPAVAGVLRPVLLLPASALAGLSPGELDFVLAHEFAHIRRQDFLLGLLQSLAETLLFFHPAVWWVSRRMSFEREQACDDAAMRITGNRRAGASALARLAELQLQHTTAMAPAAGGGQILARVRRLLEPARPAQRAQWLALLPVLLTAAVVPLLLTQRAESQTPADPSKNPASPLGAPSGSAPASPAESLPPLPEAGSQVPSALSASVENAVGTSRLRAVMRGSITDRNGVVLAESAIRNLAGTGLTGTTEIRQYPLGASASHILGYVRRAADGGKTGAAGGTDKIIKEELEMRAQVAKFKANLEGLSKLAGVQLIEGAIAYGIQDKTVQELCAKWKKDRVELEVKKNLGLGQDHPEVEELTKAIREEESIMSAALETYKATLAVNIRNIEAALKTVRETGGHSQTNPPGAERELSESLYARSKDIELRVWTQLVIDKEHLAGLSNFSGDQLIEAEVAYAHVYGTLDDSIRQLVGKWKKDRVQREVNTALGMGAGHPEVVQLARTLEAEERTLLEWVENRKTTLAANIKTTEEALKNVRIHNREMREKVIRAGAVEGAWGIEKGLDDTLRTAPSADGKAQPAVALTLDARIQRICENALRDAHIGRGAAVVLDVNNGDVLAMASVPDYDPNELVPFIAPDKWGRLNNDPTFPLVSRALSAYPPGSTFKLVTALGAGESGTWKRQYECSGTVTFDNRPFKCWTVNQGVPPHGMEDLTGALRDSCNCYFYQLGNAAGISAVTAMGEKFITAPKDGFGGDLAYNEYSFLPTEKWWAAKNQGPWTQAKTANVSIGQGEVLATPLQMAGVAAAVANGGKIWRQRLVSRRLVSGEWRETATELMHDLTVEGTPPEEFPVLRQAMSDVVYSDKGGTGKAARSTLIRIAGKTGTAQKWRTETDAKSPQETGKKIEDNHTWFIGFAPFDKPRYAFAILVGNGKSGGGVCAPVAKRIMESVELMNEGKLTVDLSPLAPAKGNFDFVETVEYQKPILPD